MSAPNNVINLSLARGVRPEGQFFAGGAFRPVSKFFLGCSSVLHRHGFGLAGLLSGWLSRAGRNCRGEAKKNGRMSCWMMSGVSNWSASNAIQSIFPRLTSFISRSLGGRRANDTSFFLLQSLFCGCLVFPSMPTGSDTSHVDGTYYPGASWSWYDLCWRAVDPGWSKFGITGWGNRQWSSQSRGKLLHSLTRKSNVKGSSQFPTARHLAHCSRLSVPISTFTKSNHQCRKKWYTGNPSQNLVSGRPNTRNCGAIEAWTA